MNSKQKYNTYLTRRAIRDKEHGRGYINDIENTNTQMERTYMSSTKNKINNIDAIFQS